MLQTQETGVAWADAGEQGLDLDQASGACLPANPGLGRADLRRRQRLVLRSPGCDGGVGWALRVKAQTVLSRQMGQVKTFVSGSPWAPRKASFPASLRVGGSQLCVCVLGAVSIASPLPSPHWNCGAWRRHAVVLWGKVASPSLPPTAFLEGAGAASRDAALFLCVCPGPASVPCSGHNGD